MPAAPGESAAQAARTALDLVPADPRRAAASARRALELARRDRDQAAQSTAHRALGLAARELGDLDTALTALGSAVHVAARAGLDDAAAQARMSRAFVLLSQGRITSALRDAESSAASLRGLDRARALAQRGLILQRAGRLDDALAVYATALAALRRHDDRLWEARLRNNRAILHAYQGQLRLARTDITRAEQLYEALDLPRAQAGVRWNLGFIEGRCGDIPGALAALDAAADAYRKADMPTAPLLLDQCEVLLSAGLTAEALAAVTAAITELAHRGQAADLAEAHLLLAMAQLSAGAAAAAGSSAATARHSFARQHRPSWAAVARYVGIRAAWAAGDRSGRLLRSARDAAARLDATGWSTAALDLRLLAARIAIAQGRPELAKTQLRIAARARRSPQLERQAQAWHALALLRQQTGDRRGAYAAVSAGLDAAERYRVLLGATELRMNVAGQVAELASLGMEIAIDEGSAERVLRSAERHRAATLRMRPVLPPADQALADLLAQLRLVTFQAEEARLAGSPAQALNRRRLALEERLRHHLRHSPGQPGQLPPATGLDDLTEALADRVLVEYVECAGRLYAVVLRDGLSALHRLGSATQAAAELESLRFAWRRLLTGHGSAASLQAAAELATHAAARREEAVLAPIASLLADRPLVLVPAGQLQSLPWPILPSCAVRPLTVAPSAGSWLAARAAGSPAASPAGSRRAGRRAVLVAGPGLPGAAQELAELSALYPGAQVLAGQKATVSAVLQALDGADIAHVAAHGKFRADNPLFSSLVLADGPLAVYDLERLHRAPRTIMLAACDSALSPVRPGDEMTGLAAALLTVGASTVIAAVAPLPDVISAPLARSWHQLVSTGSTPAEALQAARSRQGGPLARLAGAALVCLGCGG
jgi:CHAT domain-containing protein/tetratricopeptide (TPR) repeat protein